MHPTFYSELQHRKIKIGQPLSVKIVGEEPITINPITAMPSKHFTDESLRKYIIKKLKKYWSPDQIAGRWKGQYRRRYGTRIREKQREEQKKRRIDQRPAVINERARLGDWEGDTIRYTKSGQIVKQPTAKKIKLFNPI